MTCEFTFETSHPENPDICIRFIITMPVPPAEEIPEGAVLENHIRWREGRSWQ